jgi:hypothetical protein
MPDPLSSPEAYLAFIYALPERYPSIRHSTLVYIPSGTHFGRAEGMILLNFAPVDRVVPHASGSIM